MSALGAQGSLFGPPVPGPGPSLFFWVSLRLVSEEDEASHGLFFRCPFLIRPALKLPLLLVAFFGKRRPLGEGRHLSCFKFSFRLSFPFSAPLFFFAGFVRDRGTIAKVLFFGLFFASRWGDPDLYLFFFPFSPFEFLDEIGFRPFFSPFLSPEVCFFSLSL